MHKIFILGTMALLLSTAAFADQDKAQEQAQVPAQTVTNARPLAWSDFKLACTNPSQFQAQRPPQDIKIVCKDLRYAWVNDDAGQVNMPASRTVTSEVYSDKYHVAVDQNQMAADDSVGACSRYKEVSQTVATEQAVSCDEIMAFQGTLNDFCASLTDQVRGANASAIQLADTGRVIDTCPKAEDKSPAQSQEDHSGFSKHHRNHETCSND